MEGEEKERKTRHPAGTCFSLCLCVSILGHCFSVSLGVGVSIRVCIVYMFVFV